MIDIGGGFPIRHFKNDTVQIETIRLEARRDMDRLFDKSIDIIAEPGAPWSGRRAC